MFQDNLHYVFQTFKVLWEWMWLDDDEKKLGITEKRQQRSRIKQNQRIRTDR